MKRLACLNTNRSLPDYRDPRGYSFGHLTAHKNTKNVIELLRKPRVVQKLAHRRPFVRVEDETRLDQAYHLRRGQPRGRRGVGYRCVRRAARSGTTLYAVRAHHMIAGCKTTESTNPRMANNRFKIFRMYVFLSRSIAAAAVAAADRFGYILRDERTS